MGMAKPGILSIKDVDDALRMLDSMKGDDQMQHALEDTLYAVVLETIARGCNQFHAQKLAKLALTTKDRDFDRWNA